jgi:GDP-4-dehydro-6-deoxy-D-mannose reductase
MPTLLVTGHTGFVGRTLFDAQARDEIVPPGWRLAALPEGLDIRDPALAGLLREQAPDAVLHLAAATSVDDSFRDPDACFDVNFRGTLNVLRSLRDARFAGRLLYVSSGDCYGALPEAVLPVPETTPLRPRNPYAVSKVAAEALCYQWSQTEAMDVVIARPFNHIGPGQDERFAVASFCAQIARIGEGRAAPVVHAGNLHVSRDFSDVRDVLRAYFALLERGVRGEAYNVATGREVVLRDVLDRALALSGIDATVEVSAARQRPSEQLRVAADIGKIGRDTGWSPRIPLDRTLEETLQFWRKRVHDE